MRRANCQRPTSIGRGLRRSTAASGSASILNFSAAAAAAGRLGQSSDGAGLKPPRTRCESGSPHQFSNSPQVFRRAQRGGLEAREGTERRRCEHRASGAGYSEDHAGADGVDGNRRSVPFR